MANVGVLQDLENLDGFSSDDEQFDWPEPADGEGLIKDLELKKLIEDEHCNRPNGDMEQGLNQPGSEATQDEPCQQISSSRKLVQRMALNDHKAGMQDLDKEKINQIIFEASKGSKFYENERKKEKRVAEKIKSLKEHLQTVSDLDFKNAKKEAKKFVKEAELERDLSRIIVHIDMDAFYAAVETRDKPSLKDIPMAVGSNCMLNTSNYAARRYGVRAAMPGFIAKKLCPNLTIVPLNFKKYREVSNQVKNIIAKYDPNFCGMGLDEAYLDLTDYINDICASKSSKDTVDLDTLDSKIASSKEHPGQNEPLQQRQLLIKSTVEELRKKINEETQLTASAGIACNVMLAKICSDMNKPNGQFYLAPDKSTILNFITDLPIRKVSGIGRVCEQVLNAFGIIKCKDLYEKRALLYVLFSKISFEHFMRISLGISSSMLDNESERKSMSSETTFQEISNPEKLYQVCYNLCEGLANDLQKENLAGKSVTVKFKLTNFEVKTRTKTLSDYVDTSDEIYKIAKDIIKNQVKASHPDKLQLRLLGVRVSEFGQKRKGIQNKLDSFLSRGHKEDCQSCPKNHGGGIETDESETKSSRTDVSSEKKSEHCVSCPVCQTMQPAVDINFHIDSCLNKQAIRKLLSEDNSKVKAQEGKSHKRKLCTTDDGRKKLKKKKTLQYFWKEK